MVMEAEKSFSFEESIFYRNRIENLIKIFSKKRLMHIMRVIKTKQTY